jgi:predicted RNA binding protein YcfA (HicA-like mRNA interferase family)
LNPRKLLQRISTNQANIRFGDFARLVEAFGFVLDRQSGSHRIYKHPRHLDARVNLQPVNGQAKPYQVRQFLTLIEEYNLSLDERNA